MPLFLARSRSNPKPSFVCGPTLQNQSKLQASTSWFCSMPGHVGAMDVVARDLRARCGMLVYSVNWYQLPLLDAHGKDLNSLFSDHEHRFGVHAGDVETSVMLALKPHNVRMDQAQNFKSSSEDRAAKFPILGNGKSAKLAWQMQDYNTAGAAGNAAAATAEKGRALLDAAGQSLAKLLIEIGQLPPDTLKP